jgi:class 3 adenylate cyclase
VHSQERDYTLDTKTSTSEGDESSENLTGLASRETRQLSIIKVVLILVLMASTVLISYAVFYITSTGEESQFEAQFEDQASRLMQEFSLVFLNSIGAIDNFAVTITSHVRSMNLEWPYSFVPEFDIRGASINSLSLARLLSFAVKIDGDNNGRQDFEEYAQDLSFWVDQALARKYGHPVPPSPIVHNHRNRLLQKLNDTEDMNAGNGTADMGDMDHSGHSVPSNNYTDSYPDIYPDIFHYHDNARMKDYSRKVYYPVFECYPVSPDIVNYNLLSHPLFGPEIQISMSTRNIVVGKMFLPIPLPLTEEEHAIKHAGAHSFGRGSDTGNTMDHSGHRKLHIDHAPSSSATHDHSSHFGHDVTDRLVSSTAKGMYWDTDPYVEFIFSQRPDIGPFSQIVFPIFDDFSGEEVPAGFLASYVFWQEFIADNLPSTVENVLCVLANGCGQAASYEVNADQKAIYLGEGDLHDKTYEILMLEVSFEEIVGGINQTDLTYSGVHMDRAYCPYTIRVYPSEETRENYMSNKPLTYTLLVIGTFVFTVLTFLGYDSLNERRNNAVMENARQTNLIVSSLFPAFVRDRLLKAKDGKGHNLARVDSRRYLTTPRSMLRSYLDDEQKNDISKSKPIADLFPDTTVMFADISGFTAWSSLREPSQVFTLLETIYGEFDALAKRRRVFKVETIGDCYVAVAGLPDPQEDHPVIMAKFAESSLKKFLYILKRLEVSLGPDTTDLSLRLGLHSGPVTAGVLRGEKSRFQLFGDTVNTASRMESTSKPGEIQCSQATADLLKKAGCSDWLSPRDERIDVKGKGMSQTYWIEVARSTDNNNSSTGLSMEFHHADPPKVNLLLHSQIKSQQPDSDPANESLSQNQRLIDWHVEMISRLLRQIVAHRSKKYRREKTLTDFSISSRHSMTSHNTTPLSEVKEIIEMPKFDVRRASHLVDPESIELSSEVMSQLRDYVSTLSCMYRNNPFHNFAHASHVTMASNKLLSRVVAPDDVYSNENTEQALALTLHDYTYGLTSDPLTQFAIVFSALIHDVDHLGVSNYQLVKEKTATAERYSGKSVAEQHSVDLAWEMLMDPSLQDLRRCIYTNEAEYNRFRQLVINCVIATDIFDKDLKELRNKRWEVAFHQEEEKSSLENVRDDFNRKATIVIEHIIQAADVSHTMQHWHVYQKWNERLFKEMYQAYKAGRSGDKDPTLGWYKGEIWFFDNYVIPLAKKLKECGVFGVSSDECLNYAVQNRQEWEKKGEEIVEKLKRKYTGGSSG